MKLSDIEVGYLAGLIDGEGCISLSAGGTTIRLQPHIKIDNKCPDVIDWLYEHCGGTTGSRTFAESTNCCSSFKWAANKRELVREILELTKPYLIVKARQAQYVLDYLDAYPTVIGATRYLEDDRLLLLRWKEGMNALNKRGRVPS